ncbi:hypothetical protein EIN_094750 [Entamoeba invadens IP1]|uniref:F-box domain-containing protein n=1 Tax=Entamoeba invadens IP1 TaxID=370355 RepID=A0A0A1U3B7_ENTIV|nr:hypothetical protein EIN_094750 [Entamoeba invadens IP1]ELP87248.1 hypothetical protein EIN_094750 [Entamoeba invadens IP1]|eukprot:XP_004254019.1 hypothetical protein EIN_094750 [Entamoeba invadens IP1]
MDEIEAEEFNEDIKTYTPIPNTFKPPYHCIQSYEKGVSGYFKFRTEAFSNGSIDKVKHIFMDRNTFYSFSPETLKFHYNEATNITDIQSLWIAENYRQNYKCVDHQNYIPTKCASFYQTNFAPPNQIELTFFAACAHQNGIKIFCTMKVQNGTLRKKMMRNVLNLQREFIYYVCETINSNEVKLILDLEHEFYQRMGYLDMYPRIIFSNNFVSILTNTDYSEVVVVGKTKHINTFENLVSGMLGSSYNTPLFTTNKTLSKNKLIVHKHVTSPFFGDTPKSGDLIYVSRVVEGTVFLASQSVKVSFCNEKHTETDLELILSAELFEVVSDDVIHSNFYYHFRSCELSTMPDTKRTRTILNFFSSFLLQRAGIEYDLDFPIFSHEKDLAKQVLCQSIRVSTIIQQKHRKTYFEKTLSQNASNDKDNSLLPLDPIVLTKIFEYLPMEDLFSLMHTCKKLNGVVLTCDSIWANFHHLYFQTVGFKKISYHTPHPPKIDFSRTTFQIVRRAKVLENRWKYNSPIQRRNVAITNKPIKFLFPRLVDRNKFILCGNGFVKKLNYSTFNCHNEVAINDEIITAEVEHREQKMFVLTKSCELIQHSLNFNTQPEHYQVDAINGATIIESATKILGWRKNVVKVLDVTCGLYEDFSFSTEDNVNSMEKVDEHLLAGSIGGKTVMFFDERTGKVVTKIHDFPDQNVVFDMFNDYLIVGTQSGKIGMFDRRFGLTCIDTRETLYPIEIVKCWNKKIVIGEKNVVSFFDCKNGSLGVLRQLYLHKDKVCSVDFDDDFVMSGSRDGSIIYTSFL